jgi:molybdate transport system substrate-binding protein
MQHLPRTVVTLLAFALVVAGGCARTGEGAAPAGSERAGQAEGSEPAAGILVGAASDLRPAFESLGATFTAETGTPVTFDFGSSGQLAQRVIEGAPIDLFASANVSFVEQVLAEGVGDAATQRTYAYGRLVMWTAEDPWPGWEDLGALAADTAVRNLAIANPEHAPYGLAAEQALEASGVLDAVRDRLVFGENISDTQRLVETGNAEVGILALSLALAADERGVGTWVPVDPALHEPLQQDLLVTASDPGRAASARAFADLVDSEAGREVMRRYGFLLPGEDDPT